MNLKSFFSNMMMLCVAIAVMSITMVSCSDKDDNGLHNDDIDQWNASERSELFQWLNQRGFLPK